MKEPYDRLAGYDDMCGDDPELQRIAHELHWLYGTVEPPLDVVEPPHLNSLAPFVVRRSWSRSLAPFFAVALAILGVGAVLAAKGVIFNLGQPTAAVSSNPYFPLSGFRYAGKQAELSSHPELLVLSDSDGGGFADAVGALERWPIIKALQQFGTLSGVQPLEDPSYVDTKAQGGAITIHTPSTFDWSHARYHSKYLAFEHKDLYTYDGKQFQRLSAQEEVLWKRYGNGRRQSLDQLPSEFVVAVGGYVETTPQVLVQGDFQPTGSQPGPIGSWLSYATIQNALATGTEPPQSSLVEDVNAEANIITALICHADGSNPMSVCGRAVIKRILHSVR